jgi:ring-1,2-phenylacetyl-CoA epoxidase subunit PaaD
MVEAPARTAAEERAWAALAGVVDPEIPVLTILEMKLVSRVAVANGGRAVTVGFTPTFAGCPAIAMMKEQIREVLLAAGFDEAVVETDYATPWSTDSLSAEAKEKLRAFGVAPPGPVRTDLAASLAEPVPCPHCGGAATNLESAFGPTLCKQIFYCDSCRQSFERFKPL